MEHEYCWLSSSSFGIERAISIILISMHSDEPPPKRHMVARRNVELDELLKRGCRCASGDCFIQFQHDKSAVQAKRDEFRSLEPIQQAGGP